MNARLAYLLFGLGTVALASGVACGGNVTSLGSVDEDTTPSGSSSGSSSSDGGASLDDATKGDEGIDAGSGDPDGGSNMICEANPILAIAPCPPDEYCKADAPGTCGSGHCKKRVFVPPACEGTECGCDGVLRCGAHSSAAGVDVGTTQCGIECGTAGSCKGASEYCFHGIGGVAPGNEIWECKPLPQACTSIDSHTCACLQANVGSFGTCTENGGKLDLDVPLP